jgi:hypothetical protein
MDQVFIPLPDTKMQVIQIDLQLQVCHFCSLMELGFTT